MTYIFQRFIDLVFIVLVDVIKLRANGGRRNELIVIILIAVFDNNYNYNVNNNNDNNNVGDGNSKNQC